MASPSNETSIARFLAQDLGLDLQQIAGVLGNFQTESGFSPTAFNAKEGAIGIAQWEGGRRTALDSYAAAHGLTETDLPAQLGYLESELTGPYAGVLAQLRTAASPQQAALIFDTEYEKSSSASIPQRESNAEKIFPQLTGGNLLHGTDTAAPSPDPSSLPAKLTLSLRNKLINFIEDQKGTISGIRSRATYQALTDSQLEKVYADIFVLNKDANLPITGPVAAVEGSLSGIWGQLWSFFEPKLEVFAAVLLGLVLIVIALVILSHADDHSAPPVAAKPAGRSVRSELGEAAEAGGA